MPVRSSAVSMPWGTPSGARIRSPGPASRTLSPRMNLAFPVTTKYNLSAPACVCTGCSCPGSKQFRPTKSRSERKQSSLVILVPEKRARSGMCCSRSWVSMGDSWFETDGTVTERTEAMGATRIERDPLGELPGPADALYGIQTERARQNFPISLLQPVAPFVDAVVWIKQAAALVHKQTGRLDPKLADAIVRAADEVLAGQHRQHIVVGPYQAGGGTSPHTNCNEDPDNRPHELLGGKRGAVKAGHP